MSPFARVKAKHVALAFALIVVIVLGALATHGLVGVVARIPAPAAGEPAPRLVAIAQNGGDVRRAGRSFVRKTGKILEVHLAGTPAEIGAAQSVLLHDEMVGTEKVVWELLDDKVPSRLARALLLDIGQFAYRNVASGMSEDRRREIAAGAAAFRPDPFESRFDTFQRFVYLNALYDISLAYERSPLLGCTTFTFSGSGAAASPILARAFDFDVHDVFDESKAVFFVAGDGKIPFASVAWPGLVGVVSGMNREGVAAVVHGARAGPTRTTGEPVVHELRRVLESARTTEEAVRALGETEPLVSHIVVVSDAAGRAASVERIPGSPPFVRPLGERDVVTNHLEGPSQSDPKNLRVRETSSTLPRRARGDELVRAPGPPVDAARALSLLRDRSGAGGVPLALGDRRAVDALIATHAVIMETAARRLWVSESPHMLGRFLAFDLQAAFADDGASPPAPPAVLPADPILADGTYEAWQTRGPPSASPEPPQAR